MAERELAAGRAPHRGRRPELVRLGPGAATPFQPEPHRHHFSTLLVVTSGTGIHNVDGVDEEIRPRQIVLLGEGQPHSWRVSAEPVGVAVEFTGRMLDEDLRLPDRVRAGAALGLPTLQPAPDRWARLRVLLELIGAVDPDRADGRAVTMLLGALLIEAFGSQAISGAPGAAEAVGVVGDPAEQALVRMFRLAALQRPSARRGVAWHARALGVSERQLSELVRRHTGATPGAVLRAGIADEAGRLLRTTDVPIHSIADRLGFSDPAYFSRFVRRELGWSPSAYRDDDTRRPHRGGAEPRGRGGHQEPGGP